ncbi:hypothetical protein EEJ42_43360 [Streptomyces botrytidirepellens]|uniref:Uncharacterized protein n=1 Tax=Streptomyces botrytidirepellens TaxID=2486417 RepID=A0A3M8SWC9_9ACTN|nr:hypothetical protein EEJ42_43360 [Streptomyces botrytidirepellens]
MMAGQRASARGDLGAGAYGLRGVGAAGRPPGPALSPITAPSPITALSPIPSLSPLTVLSYREDRRRGETTRGGTPFAVTVRRETPATREQPDHRGARPLLGGLVGHGLPSRRGPVPGQ